MNKRHRWVILLCVVLLPEFFTVIGKEPRVPGHMFVVPFRTGRHTTCSMHENDSVAVVDLNRPFSEMETQHVNVPTPGLFERSLSFKLVLDEIQEWSYPLPVGRVISHFGGKRKNHSGTDIKASRGEKILAVFDGVVRFSGKYSAYGKMVVLRHANGLETCYAHNKKNLVKVGDVIKAGEPIALVGRTGRATTEHCHFEVRVNGYAIDSNNLFDHSSHKLRSGTLVFKKSGRRIIVKSC